MLRAVIFDLDGTLVDTPQAIVDTMQAALRPFKGAAVPAGEVRARIGLPLPEVIAGLLELPADSATVAQAVEVYRRVYIEQVTPRTASLVFPGVREGLPWLRSRGLRLAVATGKAQSGALNTVSAAGIASEFEVVAGYDLVARPKPDPATALYVLEKLQLAPREAVVVGDTTHDVLMAKGAGVPAIAVTYGAHDRATLASAAPEWWAGSFHDVLRILDGLLPAAEARS